MSIIGKIPRVASLDYVAAWYYIAARYIQNTRISVAFVSTNSITQGAQVSPIWTSLYSKYGININFAYRTFKWSSESKEKAAVHCVIIGFSLQDSAIKIIFDNSAIRKVQRINPYLLEAPIVLIDNRGKPLCNVPEIVYGNMPNDGGQFIFSADEKELFIKKEPKSEKFFRQYQGADDYINGKTRYCLWLNGASPKEIAECPSVYERVKAVREIRLNSSAQPTREKAETPHLFFFISQPELPYLMIPRVSSENRRYVPIGFVSPAIIASDAASIVCEASMYHFGVLTSNVHNAWLRTVGGRLKSDYRYSGGMVYNTFPWCNPTAAQKAKIEQTAQAILDARALFPDCTLAELYDEVTMPVELSNAHRANDKAVMEAYGFDVKTMTESTCVAELMKMYQKLTKE